MRKRRGFGYWWDLYGVPILFIVGVIIVIILAVKSGWDPCPDGGVYYKGMCLK